MILGLFNIDLMSQTFNMYHGRLRTCKGTIKDSDKGKTADYYDHDENMTWTISVPGAKSITLKFKKFCTEINNDVLRIYNGKDTNSTLIGRYSGPANRSPGTVSSTDSFITLHFKSDKSIACEGWEAEIIVNIITPVAPSLSINQQAKCKDQNIVINLSSPLPCDSLKPSQCKLTGPLTRSITSIVANNCNNGKATQFTVNFGGILDISGNYTFEAKYNFRDFCDSLYPLSSKLVFSITDCPLKVVLKADRDTVCKGSNTWLRATVAGGVPARYVYTWSPSGLNGAGPHRISPTTNTRYILRVTDGVSVPSADTVDIVVLDPPKAMADTQVCYTSGNFNLRGTPAGGKWFGNGIVNSTTGEFKPVGQWGWVKTWYQIGSCADTVQILVYNPWQLDNIYCQNTGPQALWWYWPTDGIWSGPRVTSNGIFNPDTAQGTYKLTYNWKGCVTFKNVTVTQISVPKFDTTCESRTRDTLKFSPKGMYPNWFPGLTDSYNGFFNPSQMGGPGNKLIFWRSGGCNDTTRLTVLPIKAGPIDTFCPNGGMKKLIGFRPNSNYTWHGKGIVNPNSDDYDPSFVFALNKTTAIDTLRISASICSDVKYVYIFPTKIVKKDTLKVCFEDTGIALTVARLGYSPAWKGLWTGKGIAYGKVFKPGIAGYGNHTLYYHKNGCTDSVIAFVRPKPIVQKDTQLCISSSSINCYRGQAGGTFWGNGITNNTLGTFNPKTAGKGTHWITYFSVEGCRAVFKITVDTIPEVKFLNTQGVFCFKDTNVELKANLPNGFFAGKGVNGNYYNPSKGGSGNYTLSYTLQNGACIGSNTFDITVIDTLKLTLTPKADTICPGEMVWLRSKATGGDNSAYKYVWSNGQLGSGTFVSPTQSSTYSVTVSDGCSDPVSGAVNIEQHPVQYFLFRTSPPVCYGKKGYIKVNMTGTGPIRYVWDVSPQVIGDSVVAQSGNTYRVTATNTRTGCSKDTVIEIPGFSAVKASFSVAYKMGSCLNNLEPQISVIDNSENGEFGYWYWGNGRVTPYEKGFNPRHSYTNQKNSYQIKLVLSNSGGCKDSFTQTVCYRDTVIVHMPNAFSPNNRGGNETFSLVHAGVDLLSIKIYNRWGQKVFESSHADFVWDGLVNGKPCPTGIYNYELLYKGKKTRWYQKVGAIYILR